MEKVLHKLAENLNNLDEASLMSLWDDYYHRVKDFTPSKAWEEDTLILSMIQAVRWKNQLFNHHWSGSADPEPPETHRTREEENSESGPSGRESSSKPAKVLHFRTPKKD